VSDAFRYYRAAAEIRRLSGVEVDGRRVTVTPAAKLVAGALADHTNAQTGRCDPSQETLAEAVGASVRTVRRGLDVLRRIGRLQIVYGRGKRASYLLQTGQQRPVAQAPDRTAVSGRAGHRRPVQTGQQCPVPRENCEVELRSELTTPRLPAREALDSNEHEQDVEATLALIEAHFEQRLQLKPRRTRKDVEAVRGILSRLEPEKARATIKRALTVAAADDFTRRNVADTQTFARWLPRLLNGAAAEPEAPVYRCSHCGKPARELIDSACENCSGQRRCERCATIRDREDLFNNRCADPSWCSPADATFPPPVLYEPGPDQIDNGQLAAVQ
jgi:hypothetical protein